MTPPTTQQLMEEGTRLQTAYETLQTEYQRLQQENQRLHQAPTSGELPFLTTDPLYRDAVQEFAVQCQERSGFRAIKRRERVRLDLKATLAKERREFEAHRQQVREARCRYEAFCVVIPLDATVLKMKKNKKIDSIKKRSKRIVERQQAGVCDVFNHINSEFFTGSPPDDSNEEDLFEPQLN